MKRLLMVLATVSVLTLMPATAASADPAVPTNFESTITSVTPKLPEGVSLRVLGGDSFLRLTVNEGHRAVVLDYGDGPDRPVYLEFAADGTVRRNENSIAAQTNQRRYGSNTGASAATGTNTPEWKVVSRDGSYAWHDHRIHWMSKSDPPLIAGTRKVNLGHADGSGDWEVDLVVDSKQVLVRGQLELLESPNSMPWFALIAASILAMVGAVAFSRAGQGAVTWTIVAAALVVAAALATGAGFAQWREIPADAGGTPITAIVPLVGLLAAVAAVATRWIAPNLRLPAVAAAVAALAGWAIWRRDVLVKAVLPTPVPTLDRVATALCLGLAIGAAVALLWKPPTTTRRTAAATD